MKKISKVLLVILLFGLTGCTGVEPENRSYPLIMSVDYQEGEYQVIYGMANLREQTGQQKSSGESNLIREFTGSSMKEILDNYNSSQEFFLDMGHLQVLVLGQKLLDQDKHLKEILQYMEEEPMIGDNIYVLLSEDPKELMAVNGIEVESLSNYLTGIYQNRIVSRKDKTLTLQKVFRAWHNENTIPTPPLVVLREGIPEIPDLID